MATVKISDLLYQRVQKLAAPRGDTFEDVVRRALDVLEGRRNGAHSIPIATAQLVERDLVTQGGRVPHGTALRAHYKRSLYLANVRDGRVVWEGRPYKSLSRAAGAVIQSTGALGTAVENGWRFWQAQDERGNWVPLTELRSTWQ